MPIEIFKEIKNKERLYLESKEFVFSGGEVSFKLNPEQDRFRLLDNNVQILARIQDSKDFFYLAMAVDALRRFQKNPIELILPYVPYARQDRACVKGESFSLKVFANHLNLLNLEKVTVFDPHSHVVEACINNIQVISQLNIFHKWQKIKERVLRGVSFVSPDAGANKKTSEIAGFFGHKEFIRADKLRDLNNGNIKETIVYADNLKGEDVIIADDICDGGRTFTELAKVLKSKNAGKIILYVTHGIFSKGLSCLYANGIDEIWTTNSFIGNMDTDATSYLDIKELL